MVSSNLNNLKKQALGTITIYQIHRFLRTTLFLRCIFNFAMPENSIHGFIKCYKSSRFLNNGNAIRHRGAAPEGAPKGRRSWGIIFLFLLKGAV